MQIHRASERSRPFCCTSIDTDDGTENLIGWVTFYDANRSNDNIGYAVANFKPYQAEGGADRDTFAEAMGDAIYADDYYLRYDIRNNRSETFNWWIVNHESEKSCGAL